MRTSILIVAMMVATAAEASSPDQSGVVERRADASGFVSGDGVHVLTGHADLADGCVGVGFTEPTATFIAPSSGSQLHHFTVREGVAVFVDEGISDVFEWLDYACANNAGH